MISHLVVLLVARGFLPGLLVARGLLVVLGFLPGLLVARGTLLGLPLAAQDFPAS